MTSMFKMLIGAGALFLASASVPALAHDWGGDDYGNGYSNNYSGYSNSYGGDSGYYGHRDYGGDYYDVVREHVRACRAHERFHQTLNQIHDSAHDNGFAGYRQERDGY